MSEPAVIVDTGSLVASLVDGEEHHGWASRVITDLPTPLLTTESVLTETCFLLQRKQAVDRLFAMLHREVIVVAFDLQLEFDKVSALMTKYSKMPESRHMSLADATLVRLAELYDHAAVFTVDSDFRIYRKHGRRQIPLIIPDN